MKLLVVGTSTDRPRIHPLEADVDYRMVAHTVGKVKEATGMNETLWAIHS